MLYFAEGSATTSFTTEDLRRILADVFRRIGPRHKVLALPPDFTRFHSQAGLITCLAREHYGDALTDIMPALGTHSPMTEEQIDTMFPGIPHSLFRVHDWRNDVVELGRVPAEFIRKVSGGAVDYDWPAQVNRMLRDGGHDLILSIGQVVPHEVIGMANYNKNIFVGTGGFEGINKSHFIGAAYGMERIMGRANNPVRAVFNYASRNFAASLPLLYIETVMANDPATGRLAMRGLFVGDDEECFERAADLSLEVNFQMLPEPLDNVVVYLDPSEFKSTWLGNKAIYRTRMALADNATLTILAPGLREFGEDRTIDGLIRRYGYKGTPATLKAVRENEDLAGALGTAAHLIHGSSEGRFRIVYCPGHLTREEIERAGFEYGDLDETMRRYDPAMLKDGFNTLADGERVFYISNPALGLWATRKAFEG